MSRKKEFSRIAGHVAMHIRPRIRDRHGIRRSGTWFLLCGFLALLAARSGTASEEPLPPGVEIRTAAQPETASVGDAIRIDLTVTLPSKYGIEVPEPERQTGDFYILDFLTGPDLSQALQSEKREQPASPRAAESVQPAARIVAAVYKPGKFTFPGIPVYITDPEGRKTSHTSPPVDIEIRSVLKENDTKLRDLKEQAEIPEPFRWLPWALTAAATCLLAAVAWYLRRRLRKRALPAVSIPCDINPFERAEADLRDLVAQGLPEQGQTKKFYVLLSEIVKRILEAAYGIPTAERTTEEIMDSLRLRSMQEENPGTIESLLIQCDMVKFAKYVPSKPENDRAVETAFGILAAGRNQGSVAGRQLPVASTTPGMEHPVDK